MKKPIILSVLFFIITPIFSFAEKEFGVTARLIDVVLDPESGLRTGKFEVIRETHRTPLLKQEIDKLVY